MSGAASGVPRPAQPLSIGISRLFFAARPDAMLAEGSLVIVLGWTVPGA